MGGKLKVSAIYIPYDNLTIDWIKKGEAFSLTLPWTQLDIEISEPEREWIVDAISRLRATPQAANVQKFLRFLNRNAYIITAIYGTGFLTSARRAFHLIVSNPLRLLVIDKVCDFLIFLGKLCVTAIIGILAFFFFTHRIAQAENYVPELHYY